jgi:hypothetical protein
MPRHGGQRLSTHPGRTAAGPRPPDPLQTDHLDRRGNSRVPADRYDCRNDLGTGSPGDINGIPNDDAQIWATDSTNGGVTFAPDFRVSAGTFSAPDAQSFFDYGDYTHAAFQSHLFYPAWSDNSNSTGQNPDGTLHQLDLFTAKVVIP